MPYTHLPRLRVRRLRLALAAAAVLAVLVAGCGGGGAVSGNELRMRVLEEVDQPPEIEGGYAMVDSLKRYPQRAAADGARGTIRVRCVVTARGRATRLRLVAPAHNALNTEALRVVRELRFQPGKVGGATVPIEVEIPVRFP